MTAVGIDVLVNVQPLDALQQDIAQGNTIVEQAVRTVFQRLQPALLSLLRTYPPVPPASRYRRTFRLKNNWNVTVIVSGEAVEIYIGNQTSYASYVVGGLTGNQETAARFQQTNHRNNDWQLAQRTVDDWLVEFIRQLEIEIGNQFGLTANARRL